MLVYSNNNIPYSKQDENIYLVEKTTTTSKFITEFINYAFDKDDSSISHNLSKKLVKRKN